MSFNKKPKAINPDEVDPSVYYYDEVYDEMKETAEAAQNAATGSNTSGQREPSKYIQGIIETAEQRKTDRELRKFKKIARDREESEKDLDDEDVYITEAYQKKLDEMKKVEDQRRRAAQEDAKRTMNFVKSNELPKIVPETRQDKKNPKKSDHKSSCDTTNDEPKQPTDALNEGIAAQLADNEVQQPKTLENIEIDEADEKAPQARRKPLKTLRERRHYLRKILAKRTVGQVFEEAKRRYKQRKTLT